MCDLILYSVPCPSLSPVPGKHHSGTTQRKADVTVSVAGCSPVCDTRGITAFLFKENGTPVSDGLYLGVTWTINRHIDTDCSRKRASQARGLVLVFISGCFELPRISSLLYDFAALLSSEFVFKYHLFVLSYTCYSIHGKVEDGLWELVLL